MLLILSLFLIMSIILKFFTPKKPNYLFGYQLGSAKKSIEHWKIANQYAANYMLVVNGVILCLALIFDYQKYDGEILLLGLFLVGSFIMYFSIEKRLKKIETTSGKSDFAP